MSILHPIDTFFSVRRLIPVPPSPFQVNEPFLDLMASLVDGPNGVDGKPPLLSLFFFFFTLVASPGRSLSLKLSDTRVYEP